MTIHRVFLVAGLLGLAPLSATAGTVDDRYAPRPPVLLSPDLAEPWIMQLRPRYRDGVMGAPVAATTPPPRYFRPESYARAEGYARPVVVAPYQTPAAAAPAPSGYQRQAAIDPAASRRSQREPDPKFLPTVIDYTGPQKPGTIIVNTEERYLYLVEEGGKARRYGVGVGRPGFQWAGEHRVTRKAEWPDWTPPAAMLKRQPHLPHHMDGGPNNPLGARALYLGSTEYRIHGSNEPWTIGQSVSSGCIRMRNEDVTDLYGRVKVGTKVIVI